MILKIQQWFEERLDTYPEAPLALAPVSLTAIPTALTPSSPSTSDSSPPAHTAAALPLSGLATQDLATQSPTPAPKERTDVARLVQFVWQCTQGTRPWLLAMTLLTALIAAIESFLFKMLGQVVDWLSATPLDQLWAMHGSSLWVMGVVICAAPVVVFLHSLIKYQTLQGAFPMRLRWQFHRLMLRQSLSFYQDEFAGRVSTKVMQTALAVRDTVMMFGDILVYMAVYLIGSLAVVAGLGGWLLVPFIGWLVLYGLCMAYFIPRLKQTAMRQADARSLMTGRITDAYSNISVVKLFAHHAREERYAKAAMQDFMGTVHGQMRLVSQFEVANQTINSGLLLALGALALWQWQTGISGVGALAASLALALRLQGLSHWIMWEIAGLFENVGTVQDGMKTLSTPHSIVDAPNAPALQLAKGQIDFDRVQFNYPNGKAVFNGFDLHVQAGEKVGIVGRSGSGKSTLVNLLMRFYDVSAGAIRIDGQNVQAVQQESLRRHMAMVTQDTSLLHRSVRDNIAYGRPEASDTEIIAAAQNAHAWDFIQALHDKQGRTGLDVMVGERGVKLSGGQRQRVAIARVMLKNAPILILDEATSALDSEVEAAIQESLNELMEGKTVIAIAHRLSTIAKMDRLIVIDEGRIVEQGTHSQLLTQGGLYASLWQRQTGEFLDLN